MVFNWEAISAIATAFMTVATFAAVVVALWSAKYAHKAKIKLSFKSYGGIATTNPFQKIEEFVSVTVTNCGQREVVLHAWGMKFKSSGQQVLIIDNSVNPLAQSLPYSLKVDETVTLQYNLMRFHDNLVSLINDSVASPTERILFYVDYGAGKRKWTKSDLTVRALIQGIESKTLGKCIN